MTRFLLIRHALTDSVGKHLSGRMAGIFLSEKGRLQAQQLAEWIADLPISAIYSSPLERAIETAAPLAQLFNLETNIDEHFLEIDFGQWTNLGLEELENDKTFQQFNSFRSCTRIPGGELMLEAQARMINGLEHLGRKHENKTIAVISHSDMIKAAVAYYAGIHLDMFQRIEISPASVSIIETFEQSARILLINYTGRLNF
jgi:probable phosphomutase (TIGR03848 family)